MKKILIFILVFVLWVPVSFFIAVILSPVSNWLEKITGIEMVGHSGPSGLFFGVTYIVSLLILFVLIKFLKKK